MISPCSNHRQSSPSDKSEFKTDRGLGCPRSILTCPPPSLGYNLLRVCVESPSRPGTIHAGLLAARPATSTGVDDKRRDCADSTDYWNHGPGWLLPGRVSTAAGLPGRGHGAP